jgi:hypothetical protein
MAHGAFGKQGEAFSFHSSAGAVPVLISHRPGRGPFSLTGERPFDEAASLRLFDAFVEHLWSGGRAPARVYVQDTTLPLIVTMAADGTYLRAMTSVADMTKLVEGLQRAIDQAADMDW